MSDLNTAITSAYEQVKQQPVHVVLANTQELAYSDFNQLGFPTQKMETWKYTRLNQLLQKPFALNSATTNAVLPEANRLAAVAREGHQVTFVNGIYAAAQSKYDETAMELLPLREAVELYPEMVALYLNRVRKHINDGMQALNTVFVQNGLFIRVKKNAVVNAPVYINHLSEGCLLVQPRILALVEENAQVQFVENYFHNGADECFTNAITEITVLENARMEYYKIQDMPAHTHHVGTTQVVQAGKCFTHCVTVTLNGGTIRNNLNMIFEKANNEGHMYGLYMVNGNTHIDNQTVVDNLQPGCLSNELYKGVIDGKATGVFNGRIYVRQEAQKTNAYQSNRNVLIGPNASVNAKPQLEIFADDVKCSHGCTVGRLDETALFYMRTRGIGEEMARALLLQAFAADIVNQVNIPRLKTALQEMIAERLHTEQI